MPINRLITMEEELRREQLKVKMSNFVLEIEFEFNKFPFLSDVLGIVP